MVIHLNNPTQLKPQIDLINYNLIDSSGNLSLDWAYYQLIKTGKIKVNWDYGWTKDSTETYSIDWENRILYDSLGAWVANFYTPTMFEVVNLKVYNSITASNGNSFTIGNVNMILPDYSSIPISAEGAIAYDYTNHELMYYNGTSWINL